MYGLSICLFKFIMFFSWFFINFFSYEIPIEQKSIFKTNSKHKNHKV
jgi:hypothetical protein